MKANISKASVTESLSGTSVSTIIVDFSDWGHVCVGGFLTLQNSGENWVYTVDSDFPMDEEDRKTVLKDVLSLIIQKAKEI